MKTQRSRNRAKRKRKRERARAVHREAQRVENLLLRRQHESLTFFSVSATASSSGITTGLRRNGLPLTPTEDGVIQFDDGCVSFIFKT